MQNILGAWRSIVEDGVWPLPYPADTRLSLVDLDDVAAAAVQVLTQDGHEGAIYELAGTPALSQSEVAAAMSVALGRQVRIEEQSVEAWQARAKAGGLGEHECAELGAVFRYYASHGLAGNPNSLRWLLGRAPGSLDDFLARHVPKPVTR